MLNDDEKSAVRRWYGQESILRDAKRLIDSGELVELEEYLHMTCLFQISRHSELPGFMKDETGGPLFPHNFNPKNNIEAWRDAIEIGWEVMGEKFGIDHDLVHQRIAREENEEWKRFLESVEQRKEERRLK